MLAFSSPSLSVRPVVKRCDSAKVADRFFPQKPEFVQGVDSQSDFAFTQSWSELLFALVLVSSKEPYTLPIATTMLKIGDVYVWGQLMATAVIAAAPPVILYMFIQPYIVRGLMAGAVKLRKKYGNNLILLGNIDKRALIKGKRAIREEVTRKVPYLLSRGGYFPGVDHFVPPEVSYENYRYYLKLLREIAGIKQS